MLQCAMKQKYQAFQLLQRFFACSEADLELIRIKNIGSKKYVFSPGDQINSIYFVMAGDVNLSFQNKDILVPPQNIIGDFEISKQLSRRTSSFKAHTKAKIIVLPKDFYYKIKPQVEQKEKFLTKHLASENARLNYLMSRCFINKNLVRGEWALSLNNQDDGDVVVIKSGIFSVRKYIGFGVIKKHKIELEKQFALINVGQGQFLKQNIHCDSPKGQIYVCKKQYANILACHFPQFSNILELKSGQMKQSHLQRERSIKKICIPDCELYQSVLPSVFHSERRRSNDKIQHVKTEPIESTGRSQFQKNHYEIKREKNNILTSQQTNSNLSLVPLIRIRKPSMPDKIKLPRTKVLEKYFRSRIEKGFKQKQTSPETKTNGQFQIPEEFCNKFEKKMFLKPTNPFHHHKSRSVSLDEEIKDMKQFKSLKIQENILGKSSSNSKQKKSFLLFSGSPL